MQWLNFSYQPCMYRLEIKYIAWFFNRAILAETLCNADFQYVCVLMTSIVQDPKSAFLCFTSDLEPYRFRYRKIKRMAIFST